jgi:hypothetical protein
LNFMYFFLAKELNHLKHRNKYRRLQRITNAGSLKFIQKTTRFHGTKLLTQQRTVDAIASDRRSCRKNKRRKRNVTKILSTDKYFQNRITSQLLKLI